MKHRLAQLTAVVAVLYTLGLLALSAGWAFAIEQFWWLKVSNLFGLYLFLPVLALIPLAIMLPSWVLRGATGLALLLLLTQAWPLVMPPLGRTGTPPNLRVLTFNQGYWNPQPAEVVRTLRAQQADIVALQELSPATAQEISTGMQDRYPYQWLQPVGDTAGGMGLLSRYPLLSQQRMDDQVNRFRAQRVTIEVQGQVVTLFNVHLPAPGYEVRRYGPLPLVRGFDDSGRQRNTNRMIQEIQTISGPLIMLGDFNTGDREPGYRQIAAHLQDVYRAVAWGPGHTFPNNRRFGPVTVPVPLIRLDYVWVRAVTPVDARVHCDPSGGDHCLIVADLAVGAGLR